MANIRPVFLDSMALRVISRCEYTRGNFSGIARMIRSTKDIYARAIDRKACSNIAQERRIATIYAGRGA